MLIDGKRALAYTTKIDEIRPIPNYDRVEHARVGGWWVIVSKNDHFQPGDTCVYFEVDSKVPSTDERFAFLEAKHYKVKTQRMCKVFSQGLIMPLSAFGLAQDTPINIDLTDKLGIIYAVDEDNARKNGDPNAKYMSMKARHKKIFATKWAKWFMKREWGRRLMFALFGRKKDKPLSFPTHFPFVHKTDEERVENMSWVLGYDKPLIVTEKLDGTSSTYIMERKGRKFEFYVLSRNVRQKTPDQKCYHEKNIYWDMAIKYRIEALLSDYLRENPDLTYVAIQGESVGTVQGNPLKLNEDDLYVFNFIRSDVGRLPSTDGKALIEGWGMKWVPILDTQYFMPNDMEEFKQFATAKSVVNPKVNREGIVLRDPTCDLSFKNVSREYLLKHNG